MRMIYVGMFLGLFLCASIFGEEPKGYLTLSNEILYIPDHMEITTSQIIINAGKGKVVINPSGKVEIIDTKLDEASMAFWDEISNICPEFKKKIIEDYEKSKIVDNCENAKHVISFDKDINSGFLITEHSLSNKDDVLPMKRVIAGTIINWLF